jgi:hypothetical protein
MTRLFGGKIAPGMADRFRSQAELLDTRSKSYLTSGGPGAGENLMAHDPTAALAAAETALSNAIAEISKPLLEDFAPAAKKFADAVSSFIANKLMPAVESHPYLTGAAAGATGLGALALGKSIFDAGLRYVGRGLPRHDRDTRCAIGQWRIFQPDYAWGGSCGACR